MFSLLRFHRFSAFTSLCAYQGSNCGIYNMLSLSRRDDMCMCVLVATCLSCFQSSVYYLYNQGVFTGTFYSQEAFACVRMLLHHTYLCACHILQPGLGILFEITCKSHFTSSGYVPLCRLPLTLIYMHVVILYMSHINYAFFSMYFVVHVIKEMASHTLMRTSIKLPLRLVRGARNSTVKYRCRCA